MWYVAGSNADDYLVHGFSESLDGRGGWSAHQRFSTPEEKLFDFSVQPVRGGYEAVFSRVWVAKSEAPPATGLWWCHCDTPSCDRAAERARADPDRRRARWHAGPGSPAWRRSESGPITAGVLTAATVRRAGRLPVRVHARLPETDRPAGR
jgi:hypothetical protein